MNKVAFQKRINEEQRQAYMWTGNNIPKPYVKPEVKQAVLTPDELLEGILGKNTTVMSKGIYNDLLKGVMDDFHKAVVHKTLYANTYKVNLDDIEDMPKSYQERCINEVGITDMEYRIDECTSLDIAREIQEFMASTGLFSLVNRRTLIGNLATRFNKSLCKFVWENDLCGLNSGAFSVVYELGHNMVIKLFINGRDNENFRYLRMCYHKNEPDAYSRDWMPNVYATGKIRYKNNSRKFTTIGFAVMEYLPMYGGDLETAKFIQVCEEFREYTRGVFRASPDLHFGNVRGDSQGNAYITDPLCNDWAGVPALEW